jgi:hypothetical protein
MASRGGIGKGADRSDYMRNDKIKIPEEVLAQLEL